MSQVISTVLFTGQFWIALIEKYEEDGALYVGRYTFGSEPGNPDLLDFYNNRYDQINFLLSEQPVKFKKEFSRKELDRNCNKSYKIFKAEQKKNLTVNKKNNKKLFKDSLEEKYLKKKAKKKIKKRGH